MNAQVTEPRNLRAQLEANGFVIVRSILTGEQVASLRKASKEATDLARAGKWPHVRTVGKQFPPWNSSSSEQDIWGVQHLMNPALPQAPIFTSAYFSEPVLSIVRELLACEDDDLVMELFNMLVRPDEPFALRWHRDDIPSDSTPETEAARLAEPAYHAQYNLALYDDESLLLVPGSHRRPRTDAERDADPFAATLPGQVAVRLGAGDIAFYDNNILHRGVYDPARERMTLHGSVGHRLGGRLRARNVLQHGVGAWVAACDFGGLDNERDRLRAEGMRDRLVVLGSESGDVGYSLQG